MILTVDNLASKYHCLPSEAMARATTFDLYVLDVSTKWSKYQNDIAEGRETKPTPKLSQQEMIDMITSVKKENNG